MRSQVGEKKIIIYGTAEWPLVSLCRDGEGWAGPNRTLPRCHSSAQRQTVFAAWHITRSSCSLRGVLTPLWALLSVRQDPREGAACKWESGGEKGCPRRMGQLYEDSLLAGGFLTGQGLQALQALSRQLPTPRGCPVLPAPCYCD